MLRMTKSVAKFSSACREQRRRGAAGDDAGGGIGQIVGRATGVGLFRSGRTAFRREEGACEVWSNPRLR